MRSATCCAIMFAASVSVPVGRCGPCCSTLPAGRMTSGFFLNCAAISGCVNSEKNRLGSIEAPFHQVVARRFDDVGKANAAPVFLDRAQRGIDDRKRDIAVVGAELVDLAAATARGEQIEL